MKELKEILDKHEKIFKGNNWIQAIIILSLFGKNMTIEELDSILTKLENGTLTKEDILKKGSERKWIYGLEAQQKQIC